MRSAVCCDVSIALVNKESERDQTRSDMDELLEAEAENGASTLPQDGRNEVPLDDPAQENDPGDLPAFLDRRRQQR